MEVSVWCHVCLKMGIVSKKRGIYDKGGCLVKEVLFHLYFINKALRGDKEMGK